nr:unnamed protein product [Callosobruchus analis]
MRHICRLLYCKFSLSADGQTLITYFLCRPNEISGGGVGVCGPNGCGGGVATPSPGTGASGKLRCPAPISRLRVEKIEGGLMVAGVVVAANCQIILPIFGFLFTLVGCVLTAASYRGPGADEEPERYEARVAFTGNSRILGPGCIVVGVVMLAAGSALCVLTRRAGRRQLRDVERQPVGFHCPLHGDFYPLATGGGGGNGGSGGMASLVSTEDSAASGDQIDEIGVGWDSPQPNPERPAKCPPSPFPKASFKRHPSSHASRDLDNLSQEPDHEKNLR